MTTTNVAAQTANALQTRKTTAVPLTMAGMKSSSVADIFSLYKDQISRAIPKHLTAERVIQLATTMVSRNPDLAQCTSESLIGAVMQASILGFEPVASLGQIYFIPRQNNQIGRKEVTVVIGYKGLVDLARRSAQIKTIDAHPVYENDEFSYSYGLSPTLVHVPSMGERGKLICAYAVSTFMNGGSAFEVMSLSDIEKVRKESSSAKSARSPWQTHYDEMARKTPLRKLCKMLPMSVDAVKAMEADNAVIKVTSFDSEGVDVSKIVFDNDGVTGETEVRTMNPAVEERSEKAEDASYTVENSVDESTGEISQEPAQEEPAQQKAEVKNQLDAQDDRTVDVILHSEIVALDDRKASVSEIQTWYQQNLSKINGLKPAKNAKFIMDAFKASLAAAKARV